MSSILLMNNGYPTQDNPKHSSYIKNIRQGLEAAHHSVELCVLNSDFSGKRQQMLRYFDYYRKIFLHDFSKYDYVLMNHYGHFALPLLKSLKKIKQPVIHWHGEDLFPSGKIMDMLFSLAASKLPGHTEHITPSCYFKGQLAEKYKIPESLIAVSPSGGIDTTLFAPADKPGAENKNIIRAGFASGLSKEKGADILLKLLGSISKTEARIQKKIELHYIYYGAEKQKYNSLFRQFPNTVSCPVMTSAEMPKFYQSVDILLFPTLRKQESLGLVALEAMSCGKPVIGTDAFAVKEYIVSGVSGEKFGINDFDDFCEKLIYAINHLDSYSPRAGIIENYSRDSVINFYQNFFY